VTELQVTACVVGSPYAFHLIAEGITVRPFSGSFFVRLPFCRFKALNLPTHIFQTLGYVPSFDMSSAHAQQLDLYRVPKTQDSA